MTDTIDLNGLRSKGECWNESRTYDDPITLRQVRRYTSAGLFNTTPTYHTDIAFTADSSYFVFARGTGDGRSAVFKAATDTGEITQLIEPVTGIGHWNVIQVKGRSRYADGNGISGPAMCLAPKTRRLAYWVGRSLRLVHLDTLEERTLIEDTGAEWMNGVISVNPSETHALFPLKPSHPDLAAGRDISMPYHEAYRNGGMVTRYVEVPLDGGEPRIAYEDLGYGCAHCPHCPTDESLVLIDRDAPGDTDRFTTRAWVLNLETGNRTELRPQNGHRFQTHAAWTRDGKNIVYHGRAEGGGWFIGITDRNGNVVREWHFPLDHYGHVSPAPDRPAIIVDGNVTPDCLLWLYYDGDMPRFEIIARHGTEWKGCPGQLPHPHPHTSPDNTMISFNSCSDGRTDVHTVPL